MRADDWEALARTIYGESRGEPYEGQVAVAWVVKNRAARPSWWGKTIEEVCFKPKQFSCWNHGDPNLDVIHAATPNVPNYLRAMGVAALVIMGDLPDPTQGATHYHSDGIRTPLWAESLKHTVTIGHHKFYREDQ